MKTNLQEKIAEAKNICEGRSPDVKTVYRLASSVDAAGEKVPSRYDKDAPLMYVDRGNVLYSDYELSDQPYTFTFMKERGGFAIHTGKAILLKHSQVRDTKMKFRKIDGPMKKYTIG